MCTYIHWCIHTVSDSSYTGEWVEEIYFWDDTGEGKMTGLMVKTLKGILDIKKFLFLLKKSELVSFSTVILCHSVIHSKCPPQQGYVRAWLQSNVCF